MKLNHEVMRYLRLDELRSHCPMNYVLLPKHSSYLYMLHHPGLCLDCVVNYLSSAVTPVSTNCCRRFHSQCCSFLMRRVARHFIDTEDLLPSHSALYRSRSDRHKARAATNCCNFCTGSRNVEAGLVLARGFDERLGEIF